MAQQDYKMNHFMFLPLAYNPGYAGSREMISANALYRSQWSKLSQQFPANFNQGTPSTTTGGSNTTYVNIHAPIKQVHGGLGLSIFNDDYIAAYQKFTGFNVTYAYRRPLLKGNLAIGATGGMIQGTDSYPYDPAEADPILQGRSGSAMAVDLSLGAYYNDEKMYFGISSTHINNPEIKLPGLSSVGMKLARHYYMVAGYNYTLNDLIKIQPSVLIKSANFNVSQFDINVNALYKDKFWLGTTYSSGHSIVALLGANITSQMRFGYSYDFQVSSIKNFSPGPIHEIWLSYDFNLKAPKRPTIIIKSPRYL